MTKKMNTIVIIPRNVIYLGEEVPYLMLFQLSAREKLPLPEDAHSYDYFGWSPYTITINVQRFKDCMVDMADAGYLGWYVEEEYVTRLATLGIEYFEAKKLKDITPFPV